MTIDETSENYNIPIEVLRLYESWKLCGETLKTVGAWLYDDEDLERLSMVMTLYDIGFEDMEVEAYMRLTQREKGAEEKRLRMLNRKRGDVLKEIHCKEKQLERLDYLRHEIQLR